MGRLPAAAQEKVDDATQLALKKCLQVALRTLGKSAPSDSLLAPPPDKPHNLMHKLAVATTGAAGGAFGLFALPVELPVTTTLMFRSICDIARSEGDAPEIDGLVMIPDGHDMEVGGFYRVRVTDCDVHDLYAEPVYADESA